MWPNPQENAELVTFTEETFNGKLHFLGSVRALPILKDSAPITKWTMWNGALLDLSGIITIVKGNESLSSNRPI